MSGSRDPFFVHVNTGGREQFQAHSRTVLSDSMGSRHVNAIELV